VQAVLADQDRRSVTQGRENVIVFVSDDILPGTRMAGRPPSRHINIVFEGVGYAGQVLGRIPIPFIRRRVLDSEHFALAIKAVASTPKYCSNNMMISTKEGYAINFECVPDEAFAILLAKRHRFLPGSRYPAGDDDRRPSGHCRRHRPSGWP